MKPNQTIQFMQDVLAQAGYEVAEIPENPGMWCWENETADCETPLPTQDEAILDAWASAAEYVRDIIGQKVPSERWAEQWNAMSVGQQAKLILLSFDDDEQDDALADGLFQAIRENDLLRKTLGTIGRTLESEDPKKAVTEWQRAKLDLNLGALGI